MTFPFSWWRRRGAASTEVRPGRKRKAPEPLRFPLQSTGRIALLDSTFETRDGLQIFSTNEILWLRQYAPESLVCPLDAALSLADQKLRGLLELPSLDTAIVVITSLEDSALEDHHRDLLWRAFGVPVFEQFRGPDGNIIARECEVHDGLHLAETLVTSHLEDDELVLMHLGGPHDRLMTSRTGISAEIVNEHCECGSETPRLRKPVPLRRKTAAAAAGGR